MVHILAAANRMLEVSGFNIGNLKLQKLLYYAYGANLILNPEEELIEGPQAWHYGPVFPSVYHAFKRYGARIIRDSAEVPRAGLHGISTYVPSSSKLHQIIEEVFDVYGKMDESYLVRLTHQQGSPWAQAYTQKQKVRMSKQAIKEHFEKYVVSQNP